MYYALKSNPHPHLLKSLQEAGAFFDVCTAGEIEIAKTCGIEGKDTIHTHPIKSPYELKFAIDYGCPLFVVDNECEVEKLIPYKDKLRVLVRISVQNPHSLVNLSYKFGIGPDKAMDLIRFANAKGISVAGLCFHAGSQNVHNEKYLEALDYCRDIARDSHLAGIPLEIIDIGGGFPVTYAESAPEIFAFCRPISEYLENTFGGYRIIAEPGRFVSGPSTTLAATVVGKSERDGRQWYYLDDGLYNSFSGAIYDHARYPFSISREGEKLHSVIAGPTCDSIDVLYEDLLLPELFIGDVILFYTMGAYTNASAGHFNGFSPTRIIAVD
jgi:ornithine decarboxylase